MSFDENIAALVQRLPKLTDHLLTEEATKNALVMPFISALGYDVFNPQEVVPEYVADVGIKRGEKVDYTIMKDGEVVLLVECKKAGTDLGQASASQLYRYFSVTKTRIAILTNGVHYWFYSDLDAPNRMDARPFLVLDLSDPRPSALQEVRKLAKGEFELDRMLSAASELKYLSEIKSIFAAQLEDPDEEFVRFFFSRANPGGRFTASAREDFTPLLPRAFSQFVSDLVSKRLRNALQSETRLEQSGEVRPEESQVEDVEESADGIVTTEEELEGYRVVLAIVCSAVSPARVAHRDTKSYIGILLDDNNRKPICRLWFNTKQKYLGVFDESKDESRIPIEAVSDIYLHADKLRQRVEAYEAEG